MSEKHAEIGFQPESVGPTKGPEIPSNEAFRREEWKRIHHRRSVAFELDPDSAAVSGSANESPSAEETEQPPADPPQDLVGLSLSGGGLRSAMFNDGFLQGLSHRGLLRYVDYLCSVSGGGYIASHLATRNPQSGEKSFHADPKPSALQDAHADGNEPRIPWHLGRDPETGAVDPHRMRGVGQYLAQPITAAVCYVTGLITSSLIYLGCIGIFAVLVALFWRSFDDPDFRYMLTNVLGFRFGSELLIAFYPAILAAFVWFLLFAWRQFLQSRSLHRVEGRHNQVDRWLGIWGLVVLVSVLVSVAVFLGNGKTRVSQASSGQLFLNHYTRWFLIGAVLMQLLAFFGRHQLFQSEKGEAKHWQQVVQKVCTFGVIGAVVFAVVHWMSREDISRFTKHRSAYLVLGDVSNWSLANRVFSAPAGDEVNSQAFSIDQIDPSTILENDPLFPSDSWDRHLTNGLFTDGQNPMSLRTRPPSPHSDDDLVAAKKISGPSRFVGLVESYAYAQGFPITFNTEVGRRWSRYQTIRQNQVETLHEWNKRMDDPAFTMRLIDLAKVVPSQLSNPKNKDATSQSNGSDAGSNQAKSFDIKTLGLSETDAESLRQTLRQEGVRERFLQSFDEERRASESVTLAGTNRALIDALFPGMIQDRTVASTLVVPPHDQKTRWQWLLTWTCALSLGLLLNRFGKTLPSVYGFYRRRIARFFHSIDENVQPHRHLNLLNPTRSGLPHPLYLAARLRPTTSADGYKVENEPFVFSPVYCGDTDDPQKQWATRHLRLGSSASDVTLADAVTVSGAAVTPLMSGSRSLSVILSFFGTGLGRWMHWDRTQREGQKSGSVIAKLLFWVAMGFLPIVYLYSLFGGFTATAILFCVGSLAFARTPADGTWALLIAMFKSRGDDPPAESVTGNIGHVADGGFYDYLGATELLRRRCSLIVVSDAGAHLNNDSLRPLARLCEYASSKMGIRILDLDHESPVDFKRLELTDSRKVHQPFLCARLRYPDREEPAFLVYCQMAITDKDPLEIQQIRHRFPSFPDEPTSNQFYTEDQVAAYRNLGYHIASRMCSELHRWTAADIARAIESTEEPSTTHQPLLSTIVQRMKTSFRLACYQETSYRENDIFSEAIWAARNPVAPTAGKCFLDLENDCRSTMNAIANHPWNVDAFGVEVAGLANRWLKVYEDNADVRAKYRDAVVQDINCVDDESVSQSSVLIHDLLKNLPHPAGDKETPRVAAMACHLAALAIACHEIHEGRPAAVFQIGGREKLISLAISLSKAFVPAMGNDPARVKTTAKGLVGELLELKKCTFQGSGLATTVSLAQCMVMMWGRLSRKIHGVDSQNAATRRRTLSRLREKHSIVGEIEQQGIELAETEVRIWLHRSLRANRVSQVVQAIEKGWWVAYFPPKDFEYTRKLSKWK